MIRINVVIKITLDKLYNLGFDPVRLGNEKSESLVEAAFVCVCVGGGWMGRGNLSRGRIYIVSGWIWVSSFSFPFFSKMP